MGPAPMVRLSRPARCGAAGRSERHARLHDVRAGGASVRFEPPSSIDSGEGEFALVATEREAAGVIVGVGDPVVGAVQNGANASGDLSVAASVNECSLAVGGGAQCRQSPRQLAEKRGCRGRRIRVCWRVDRGA